MRLCLVNLIRYQNSRGLSTDIKQGNFSDWYLNIFYLVMEVNEAACNFLKWNAFQKGNYKIYIIL